MNYISYTDLKFNIKLLTILIKFFYKKRSIVNINFVLNKVSREIFNLIFYNTLQIKLELIIKIFKFNNTVSF